MDAKFKGKHLFEAVYGHYNPWRADFNTDKTKFRWKFRHINVSAENWRLQKNSYNLNYLWHHHQHHARQRYSSRHWRVLVPRALHRKPSQHQHWLVLHDVKKQRNLYLHINRHSHHLVPVLHLELPIWLQTPTHI